MYSPLLSTLKIEYLFHSEHFHRSIKCSSLTENIWNCRPWALQEVGNRIGPWYPGCLLLKMCCTCVEVIYIYITITMMIIILLTLLFPLSLIHWSKLHWKNPFSTKTLTSLYLKRVKSSTSVTYFRLGSIMKWNKIILRNFRMFQCFILTWNHVWNYEMK